MSIPADTVVARVSRIGVIDYSYAEDVDDDEKPAALENLNRRGTWSVWTKSSHSEELSLGDAIEMLDEKSLKERARRH